MGRGRALRSGRGARVRHHSHRTSSRWAPRSRAVSVARSASVGPDSELIVVDDGSTDGTVAAAARTGARVLRLPTTPGRRRPGTTAPPARGEILFFVDADVVVDRERPACGARSSEDPTSPPSSAPTTRPARGHGLAVPEPAPPLRAPAGQPRGVDVLGGVRRRPASGVRSGGGFDEARFRRPRSRTSSSAIGCGARATASAGQATCSAPT